MSLQVWLPLNGDLHNQGLCDLTVTYADPVFVNGKIGKALQITNKRSSYVKIPALVNKKVLTACCWVKLRSGNAFTAYADVLSFYAKKNSSASAGLMRLECNTNANSMNWYANGIIASSNLSNVIPVTCDDTWHHLALALDGTKIYSYLDGSLLSTKTIASDYVDYFFTGSFSIGDGGMYCDLNDVRIYDHCLSAKEVEEIAKGLVLHYKLDSIPNPNLFTSLKSHNPTQYLAYQFNISEKLTTETYTMQLWNVDVSHTGKTEAELGLGVYWGGGNVHLKTLNGTKYFTNGHADYLCFQITPTSGQVSNSNASNLWLNIYNSPGDKSGTRNMSIGAWKLEKGAVATPLDVFGTTIYDSSGYNNNGTIVGNLTAAADTPRYNTATQFDGSSYILTSSGSFNWWDFEQGTFCAWMNPSATASSWSGSVGIAGDNGYNRKAFSISYYANSFRPVYCNQAYSTITTGKSLPLNEWHFCVATVNGTEIKTYFDGELVNTTTIDWSTATIPTDLRFQVGVDLPGTDEKFNGKYSDIRFYATTLTDAQVAELYNTSATIDKSGNVYAREFKEQ